MVDLAPVSREPSARAPGSDALAVGSRLTELHFPTLFGNSNPVEVEVGFGKGLFLVSSGVANPHVNYFGIEWIRKYQLYATTRAAVRELANVKTCCADAKAVLRDHIPAGSVQTVHVFFPDPWWKARHKKRLLFTQDFAASVLRVLRPGGVLHFVTDVADYFAMVTDLLAGVPEFALLPPPDENTPQHDMDYLTNFERKFRKEGRAIYRSRYQRSVPLSPGGRGGPIPATPPPPPRPAAALGTSRSRRPSGTRPTPPRPAGTPPPAATPPTSGSGCCGSPSCRPPPRCTRSGGPPLPPRR